MKKIHAKSRRLSIGGQQRRAVVNTGVRQPVLSGSLSKQGVLSAQRDQALKASVDGPAAPYPTRLPGARSYYDASLLGVDVDTPVHTLTDYFGNNNGAVLGSNQPMMRIKDGVKYVTQLQSVPTGFQIGSEGDFDWMAGPDGFTFATLYWADIENTDTWNYLFRVQGITRAACHERYRGPAGYLLYMNEGITHSTVPKVFPFDTDVHSLVITFHQQNLRVYTDGNLIFDYMVTEKAPSLPGSYTTIGSYSPSYLPYGWNGGYNNILFCDEAWDASVVDQYHAWTTKRGTP